jgi:peptidoglycan lytic transglycosylase
MPKKLRTGLLACFLLPIAVFGREDRSLRDTLVPRSKTPLPNSKILPKNAHKSAIKVQYGIASFYSNKFEGRKTYTDEIFSQKKLSAASNTLPMHTWVRVTNIRNQRSVVLRINDKMHPRNKRLIDLSRAAARKLGYTGRGLTRVKVEVLGKHRPHGAEEEMTSNEE